MQELPRECQGECADRAAGAAFESGLYVCGWDDGESARVLDEDWIFEGGSGGFEGGAEAGGLERSEVGDARGAGACVSGYQLCALPQSGWAGEHFGVEFERAAE